MHVSSMNASPFDPLQLFSQMMTRAMMKMVAVNAPKALTVTPHQKGRERMGQMGRAAHQAVRVAEQVGGVAQPAGAAAAGVAKLLAREVKQVAGVAKHVAGVVKPAPMAAKQVVREARGAD